MHVAQVVALDAQTLHLRKGLATPSPFGNGVCDPSLTWDTLG